MSDLVETIVTIVLALAFLFALGAVNSIAYRKEQQRIREMEQRHVREREQFEYWRLMTEIELEKYKPKRKNDAYFIEEDDGA